MIFKKQNQKLKKLKTQLKHGLLRTTLGEESFVYSFIICPSYKHLEDAVFNFLQRIQRLLVESRTMLPK